MAGSLPAKPADIPHKKKTWHSVVRHSGVTAFEGLENGKWVIRSALPALDEVRAGKLGALAAKRWDKETGGTTFNGMPVATDPVSQTKIIGAVVGAQIDPLATVNWKLPDGSFVTLDAAAINAMAMAVRAHVQACFDREAELKALIDGANTVEDIAAVDLNDGWT